VTAWLDAPSIEPPSKRSGELKKWQVNGSCRYLQLIAAADSNGPQPCTRNPAIISSKSNDMMIQQKYKHQIKACKMRKCAQYLQQPWNCNDLISPLCCTRNPAVISNKPNDVMIQQKIKHQIKALDQNKRVIPGAALQLGSLTSNRLSAPCTRNCETVSESHAKHTG
jgi:hypothetical protein